MQYKTKFLLLKDVPNTLNLPEATLNKIEVPMGTSKVYRILEMINPKLDHFAKDHILKLMGATKTREQILKVINLEDYPLHISFNKPKYVIFNVSAFGSDDIYPDNPDPRDTYAGMVYGLTFYYLIKGKVSIKEYYYSTITNFLLSIFMKVFGKEYGLLGTYSEKINGLKFLTGCYVLQSYFHKTNKREVYRLASSISGVNYKGFEEKLDEFDFSSIDQFIKSLSQLKIMPGIDKYVFTSRIIKMFQINFIPALEDLFRFISFIATSSVPGCSIASTFISRYNTQEYDKLLEIPKSIFLK